MYTYPVLTLPPEIVSEIFVHFIPVYPRRPRLCSPLILAQICRPWREITFSAPRLWRAVHMSVYSKTTLNRQLNLVELLLARSGSCLLSVHLSSQSFNYHIPLLELLAPHCERLQHLRLCLSAPRNLHWDSLKRPLLSLQSLVVSGKALPRDYMPTVSLAAPLLKKVALWSITPVGAPCYRGPNCNLSALTVESIHLDCCTLLLPLTPNLVFCKLGVTSTSHHSALDPSPPFFLH